MFDGQWELIYEGVDLVMGSSPLYPPSSQRGLHFTKAPEIGDVEIVSEDQQRPRSDGISFGQDFRGGRLITFDLGLLGRDQNDVKDLHNELLRAWRGDTLRVTPGGVATLCTSRSGRLRQVYGRPRQASAVDTLPRSAYMLGTAVFQTVDDLFYDGTMSSLGISLVPASSGGFAAPFTVPFTTSQPTYRNDTAVMAGNADTQPIVVINGPVVNPRVKVVGNRGHSWELVLTTTVPAGQQLVIDCRPWVRAAVRSDGASVIGSLSRSSRLARAVLKPDQNYSVTYSGTDVTGTTTMTFAWNNAYVSE